LPKEVKENYLLYVSANNKIKAFRKVLDFKKQVDDDKIRLFESLQEQYNRLAFLLKGDNLSLFKYEDKDNEIEPSIYPPNYILNSLNDILKIEDTDSMYLNLKSFIEEYGTDYNVNLANKMSQQLLLTDDINQEDIKTKEIQENKKKYLTTSPFHEIQYNPETSTYYFYKNIFKDVNVPIICRHHEELLKTPLTTNENRQKIIDNIVKIWGIVSGGNHICRNCGEIIRQRNYSIMEGFDKDDRTMMFREKVIDDINMYFLDDEDVEAEISLVEEQKQVTKELFTDILRLLKAYQDVVGVKLTYDDTKLLLKWTISMNNNDFKTRLDIIKGILNNDPKYKKNQAIINTLTTAYKFVIFIERLVASIIHILNTSNYIIYGTGTERELKVGYVTQNFGDIKTTIDYFIKKIQLIIRGDTRVTKYKNVNTVINNNDLYKKVDITLTSPAFYQYVKKAYDEIGQDATYAKRKELYEFFSEITHRLE
jgi:hypothetical protein